MIVLILVTMYINSLFSKAIDIAINLKTPNVSLLTRCKAITYVNTSSFMYVHMQVTKFVKQIG